MLTSRMQISAISWKAKECGLSYGAIQSKLSPEELQSIYDEFEALIEQRRQEEQERLDRGRAEKSKKVKRPKVGISNPKEKRRK